MECVLVAQDVSLTLRGSGFTLHVAQLDVTPGVHVVVGLNGSGKTTLIRLLSGLVRPARGMVSFEGAPIDSTVEFQDYCRRSGYLWQNFSLAGSTPVLDYLAYRGWLSGLGATKARLSAGETAERLGLTSALGLAIGKLSGGTARRVGIAAAAVHGPRLLLLDEPSSGLDLMARDLVAETIQTMVAAGVTVVVAEHDPGEIARYDATVHAMVDGHLASSRWFAAGGLTEDVLRDLVRGAAS